MATTATFSSAHLADAVSKAARVAPSKGEAHDKAAGILLNVDEDSTVVIATDIETTYRQVIPTAEFEGDPVSWRLSSVLFSKMLSTLAMGDGQVVKMIDTDDSFIRVKQGRYLAKFSLLNASSFPAVRELTDLTDMIDANAMSSRIESVAWACASTLNSPLAGVYLDGQEVVATDTYCLAFAPCPVAVAEPVCVQIRTLAGLLKQATDISVRANASRLEMQLDAETQATASIIMQPYPNVKAIIRKQFDGVLKFSRSSCMESIQRTMVHITQEKGPKLELTVRPQGMMHNLVLDIEASEVGRIQDAIDVEMEQTDGSPPINIKISPSYLLSAITHARNDTITLKYGDPTSKIPQHKLPILIEDGTGYKVFIMPIVDSSSPKPTPTPPGDDVEDDSY